MGHSVSVFRGNTPRDNPNTVKEQPRRQEDDEIPGLAVHLILKQHHHWYSCLDIFSSSSLSLTITILFGFPHRCSYFQWTGSSLMEGLPPPGESRNAAVFNASDPTPPSRADYNWQPLLVIELLHFPSRLSHVPLGALHSVSKSREPLVLWAAEDLQYSHPHGNGNLFTAEISLSASLTIIGHHRVSQCIMRQ